MSLNTAVIVGRFQAHALHSGYFTLFNEASKYDKLLIVVCNAYRIGSDNNPLSFYARKTIIHNSISRTITIPFEIVPLNDCESDEVWSNNLDFILECYGIKNPDFLVSRDSFESSYSGKFKNNFARLETLGDFSSTAVRKSAGPNKGSFYEGVVWRSQQGYPQVTPTVDIGVVIVNPDKEKFILLGRKKGRDKWCLPGGFVDNTDSSFTSAACRELLEETNINISKRHLTHIGSYKIDDWRYTGSRDCIITSLFYAEFTETIPDFQAADDLEEVKLFLISSLELDTIVDNHQELVQKVIEHATNK